MKVDGLTNDEVKSHLQVQIHESLHFLFKCWWCRNVISTTFKGLYVIFCLVLPLHYGSIPYFWGTSRWNHEVVLIWLSQWSLPFGENMLNSAGRRNITIEKEILIPHVNFHILTLKSTVYSFQNYQESEIGKSKEFGIWDKNYSLVFPLQSGNLIGSSKMTLFSPTYFNATKKIGTTLFTFSSLHKSA